jgi:hypothetical protein
METFEMNNEEILKLILEYKDWCFTLMENADYEQFFRNEYAMNILVDLYNEIVEKSSDD